MLCNRPECTIKLHTVFHKCPTSYYKKYIVIFFGRCHLRRQGILDSIESTAIFDRNLAETVFSFLLE